MNSNKLLFVEVEGLSSTTDLSTVIWKPRRHTGLHQAPLQSVKAEQKKIIQVRDIEMNAKWSMIYTFYFHQYSRLGTSLLSLLIKE